MRICTVEGCEEKHHAKGFCKGHYGKSRRTYHPLPDRDISENKTNKEGYIVLTKQVNKKKTRIFEHIYIWEKCYGIKKPEDMHIHHIDNNPSNNDISNLQLVDELTHKRIHAGCKLINDIWYRHCSVCNELLEITDKNFYNSGKYLKSACKKCVCNKIKVNYHQNSDAINFKRRGNREPIK